MGCSYFLPMLKRLDFSFFSWRFVLWNHFLILSSNLSTLFFMVSAYDIFSYPKIMNIFSWLSFSKLGCLLEGVLLYLFMLQSTIHVEFNFVYAVRYESWFLIFLIYGYTIDQEPLIFPFLLFHYAFSRNKLSNLAISLFFSSLLAVLLLLLLCENVGFY